MSQRTTELSPMHPVLRAATVMRTALDDAAGVEPLFMTAEDKAEALVELSRLQSRLAEMRLRVLAHADDVAATTGARDAGDWLAHATRSRPEDTRAELRLAESLTRRPQLADALRVGHANEAQTRVIARCLDDLPTDIDTDVVDAAEQALVGYAADFGPRQLHRLGRHILDIVAPDIADAEEAKRLAALEAAAHQATRLSLQPTGEGTTRIAGLIPDAAATRLRTYLEAYTNPRREPDSSNEHERGPYSRRMGLAFCSLLEHLDPTQLPVHGGEATTVIVTLSLDDLRSELATADLIASTGGDDGSDQITAAQARRLACTANILPAVLGGDSEILDLGRSRRLFVRAQQRALRLRDRTCRAEGCSIPAPWCEAHHLTEWANGGNTDLDVGVLFCAHHHHRAHDPTYRTERLPDRRFRFHRRVHGDTSDDQRQRRSSHG